MTQCHGCGASLTEKLFCGRECRDSFYNRMSKRGRVAMPLALAWRAGRGSKAASKDALAELCAYLDHCNAEDREAGRPPMSAFTDRRGDFTGGNGWRERIRPSRSASPNDAGEA